MNDPVNHPSHYTDGQYEVIDFIEATDSQRSFYIGNAIKYIARAGKKDPGKKKEDLEKAIWYVKRYLQWSKEPIGQHISIEDFIRDKGLENTLQGFALELLLDGKADMAIKALKIAITENSKEGADA